MRVKGRQLRFVAASIGVWTAARATVLWMGAAVPVPAGDSGMRTTVPGGRTQMAGLPGADGDARPTGVLLAMAPQAPPALADRPAGRSHAPTGADNAAPAPALAATSPALPDRRPVPSAPAAALQLARFQPGDAAPLTSMALAGPAPRSRWSGQAYLFARPGSGEASLAAGGQLGGSQAAARVAYQLNRDGPVRTAVAARLYAPLANKGAEAAVGLDWHPFPAVPLRLSVERRVDLDGEGRHAWSAYAAGGFYLERLGGRVALDGYAQGGVVGAERRDLFVDGALRAGRRWRLGRAVVTAGAGLWGAAQPGVARLDVGPRVALALPVETHTVSLALEGRLRALGQARPGSGAAMTLALDL